MFCPGSCFILDSSSIVAAALIVPGKVHINSSMMTSCSLPSGSHDIRYII